MSLGNIVGSASFQLLTGKRAFTLGLQDAQKEAESAVGKISNTFFGLGRAASQAGLALTGSFTAPIVGLSTAIFDIGRSFESAFAGVAKTFPGTNAQLAEFRDTIRDMANEMPSTREEIAGVAEVAGQLGISATGLEKFTETMVMLGETTNLSAADAATSLARLANILQTNEQDFDRLGATVVDLGNNFATTESEIVTMAARIAGAGQVVGLTEAQVLGLATALSSVGVRVEAGGSAISRVLITMANAVAGGTEELELFAHVAGTTVQGFSQAFEQDAAGALTQFISGLQRIQEEGGNVFTTLDDLELGEIRVRDALLRMASAQGLLVDALQTGDTAWKSNTALTEEYGKRVETIDSQLQILKNRLSDIGVSLFDAFRPQIIEGIQKIGDILQNLTDRVTTFLESLDEDSRKFIITVAALAAAMGPALLALGGLGIAISALLNPVSLAFIALGTLVGAFILLETNSAFIEDRFPTAAAHLESLSGSFERLGGSVGDVAGVLKDIVEIFVGFLGLATGFVADLIDLVNVLIATFKLFYETVASVDFNSPTSLDVLTGKKNVVELDNQRADEAAEEFKQTIKEIDEDMRLRSESIQESFKLITGQSQLTWGSATSDVEGFKQAIQGLTLEEFSTLFKDTTTGGIEDFALMKSRVISDLRAMGVEFDHNLIQIVRESRNEPELIANLWKISGSSIIDTNKLVGQSFEELNQDWRFLEENREAFFPIQGAVKEATEALDPFSQAIRNAGDSISFVRQRVTDLQSTISLWKSDLSDTERAIEITQAQIDKYGDPDGKLAKRLDTLTWYNDRLTDRVEGAEDIWADSIAIQGDLERQLEDLDRQYKENLISPEQYAQLTEDLNKRLRETQDPMDTLTGDLRSIADSMAEGIQIFKDLLIELGLLRDETGDPIEANFTTNARDTADDIGGVGETVEEIPKENTVSILSVISGQNDLEDYQGDLKDLPEEILTKLLANTDEADTKTREQIELALGYARGEYRAKIYAETAEAHKNVSDLAQNTIGFTEGDYSAILDADTSLADMKIDPLLERVGIWATSTYQATMTIDTSSVYPAVDRAAQYTADHTIAHSPTKKGPLSVMPDWSYLFEGIPEAAEQYTDETIQRLQNFVNLAGSIFDLFEKSMQFAVDSRGFSGLLPSLGFIQELSAFAESITAEVGFVAQQFEESFLEASNRFNTAAQASLSTLLQAVELVNALTELGGFRVGQLQLDQISDLKFLVEHIVTSIGDTAALLVEGKGLPFIQVADLFAQSAQSSLALIVPAVEALQAIAQLGDRTISPADFEAASQIKFFVEHLVESLGDSAAFIMGKKGVDTSFFENSEIFSNAGVAAFELVKGITDVLKALSDARAITPEDFDIASRIKFFVEHVVQSFGDSAALLEAERGAGFVERAEAFANAVSTALDSMTSVLEFLELLSSTSQDIYLGAEKLRGFVSGIARIALDIAEIFDEVASTFNETIEGSIERLSTATSNSVTALSDTLGFILNLSENMERVTISSEDTHAYAAALAGIALDLADLFNTVAEIWERSGGESIEGSIQRLADAVSASTGALGSTLDLILNLSENMDRVTLSSEQVERFAGILASRSVTIAEAFNRAAESWDGKVHPESEKLVQAINDSLGAIGNVLSFLTNLTDALNREEGKVNFGASIRAIATQLANRGREAAEAFIEVVRTWEIEANVRDKVSKVAQVIQDSFGALNAVISFMNEVTSEDFVIRGGQMREAARRIAELGVAVGNIFAETGGRLSEESKSGLEAYAAWFANIEGIFSFLSALSDSAPDAVQNAYTFLDAAREIAAAISEGMGLLNSVGLTESVFAGGFSSPTSSFNVTDNPSATINTQPSPSKDITVHLDIDGETFQTFIIDTVNETIEEQF